VGSVNSFYDLKEKDINGRVVDFSSYKGKVVYVVNVASYCGYTQSNYDLVSRLSQKFSRDGLEIILFPCNQFGAQEPGTSGEIVNFAKGKGFSGTIMSKGDVNGPKTRPVFRFLKERTAKNYITW
jgi:glutathione peroxidase